LWDAKIVKPYPGVILLSEVEVLVQFF
jgi:hypothetical protein